MKTKKALLIISLLIFYGAQSQIWGTLGSGLQIVDTSFGNAIGNYIVNLDGKIHVMGYFNKTGNNLIPRGFAKWNGTEWIGALEDSFIVSRVNIEKFSDMLCFCGEGLRVYQHWNINSFGCWNGVEWNNLGVSLPGISSAYCSIIYKGELFIGGSFTSIAGKPIKRIARWDGTTWIEVAGGIANSFSSCVQAMAIYNDELYIAGFFYKVGTTPARSIARWNGERWDSVGRGVIDEGGILSLYVDTIENVLYAGGGFNDMGGTGGKVIAKWDGQEWHKLGYPPTAGAQAIAVYNGYLWAGGSYFPNGDLLRDTFLARWDGQQWHYVRGPNGSVAALYVHDGKLIVGGSFDKIYLDDSTYLNAGAIASLYWPMNISDTTEPNVTSLGQCYPNPGNGNIIIPYTLMDTAAEASIELRDVVGKLVKKYTLSQGSNKLEVSTRNLSDGIYNYSLILGGKRIDTKKMVVAGK